MAKTRTALSRRDFMKGVGGALAGMAIGLPASASGRVTQAGMSRVVLIRDKNVVSGYRDYDGSLVQQMLDEAVVALFGRDDATACWAQIIRPDDVVGIKSNGWPYLPTPPEVERAIVRGVRQAGVPEENIAVGDRDVRRNQVFRRSTALINTRPMRTHAWSGVGSLIKNYIMFDNPPDYHADACASLAKLWDLPITRGKTRLNVLVMLTPQFHNIGPHHFDTDYIWPYGGLIVSTDPVAADALGLRIIQQKRRLVFGEDRPLQPTAHHIALADTEYGLGNAGMDKIELVRLGWQEDNLI
ncbi:MAG: twin-arginine translocation signal domain-containing protein [Gemmatimonadota bacterium]|nr:MAG: twin-arginine translocation signal domain-containing protein [Gemmatimonadota bacterium]